MKLSARDQKICDKYSARDDKGLVHCCECPLRKGSSSYDFRCKANSHYDRKQHEWEYDNVKEVYLYDN